MTLLTSPEIESKIAGLPHRHAIGDLEDLAISARGPADLQPLLMAVEGDESEFAADALTALFWAGGAVGFAAAAEHWLLDPDCLPASVASSIFAKACVRCGIPFDRASGVLRLSGTFV